MVNDLVYGDHKDKKKRVQSSYDPLSARKKAIMKKQRESAEFKAINHMLKPTRPYQYAFDELDPCPELPLDET